ncbi:MAG: hypothetical protein JWL69_4772 [Phycisphaerales bacterium]|nr:hypothetical protein [Phycisphaerales bacterium]MDB5357599.1 hypothetical protein [Phycisphaerales bacterium]
MKYCKPQLLWMLAISLLPAWRAWGDDATNPATRPQTREVRVVKMTLHPVATSRPALQYKLLPDLTEQTPGNAVTLYFSAAKSGPDGKIAREWMDKVEGYFETPPDKLPVNEASQALSQFSRRLAEAHLAARRQQAIWDPPLREEGAGALLPYLNDMYGFAVLWAVQAKLQIARADWPAAANTLQDGFSLAHHLNYQAGLVQGLSSAHVATLMLLGGVEDWVAQPGAPNLYWSLSDLPQPFVDLHAIAENERAIPYFTFPALLEARNGPIAPEKWTTFIMALPRVSMSGYARDEGGTFESRAQAALLAARVAPRARAYLLSTGMPREQVETMPVDQVVGLYFLDEYRRSSGETWKAWELPFWEGAEHLRRAQQELEPAKQGIDSPMLAFVPALARMRSHFAQLDREVAMLRTIEALRDYAARHDGQPPDTLDQIKDLPIPLDPVTGKPFGYERAGQTAVLTAPPPPGLVNYWTNDARRYELSFIKAPNP